MSDARTDLDDLNTAWATAARLLHRRCESCEFRWPHRHLPTPVPDEGGSS